ncbi:unnamed protein product [Calicophoron daubneyi]|uniref:Uncharacterized protein n=1 Tax=Calicophoron daubneyi TaxID=300641 RepID=A0AAV2T3Q5_CALDB
MDAVETQPTTTRSEPIPGNLCYSQRTKHFGAVTADGPWPRGEIICAGRGGSGLGSPLNHVGWQQSRLRNGYVPRPFVYDGACATNGAAYLLPGFFFDPQRSGCYQQSMRYHGRCRPNGNPRYRWPPTNGYRGRGGHPPRRGINSKWSGSVPYGLNSCGAGSSYQQRGQLEDGFIDDNILADLSQCALRLDYDRPLTNSSLSKQTCILSNDCASTPHLYNLEAQTEQSAYNHLSSNFLMSAQCTDENRNLTENPKPPEKLANGKVLKDHNPENQSSFSKQPQDGELPDSTENDESRSINGHLKNSVDYLTVAWDYYEDE